MGRFHRFYNRKMGIKYRNKYFREVLEKDLKEQELGVNIHCKEDLEKQIFLVYLSKNKQKPSKNSMSLKGFEFIDRTKVVWQNLEQEIVNRDKRTKTSKTASDRVNFPKGIEIKESSQSTQKKTSRY